MFRRLCHFNKLKYGRTNEDELIKINNPKPDSDSVSKIGGLIRFGFGLLAQINIIHPRFLTVKTITGGKLVILQYYYQHSKKGVFISLNLYLSKE